MVRTIENWNDIENILTQEIIKAKIDAINTEKEEDRFIRICRTKEMVQIETCRNDEFFLISSDRQVSLLVKNQVFDIPANQQILDLRLFGIDYQKQIEEAIDKDEFVHYDIEMIFLKKVIREHPAIYFSYVVSRACSDAKYVFDSQEWKTKKKLLLEN